MNWRKQFEKETNVKAHHRGNKSKNIFSQFSYEYTEWLEEKLNQYEFIYNDLKFEINELAKFVNELQK